MRILGIDPGIGRTGWGVIDVQGSKSKAQSFGCIETPAEGEEAAEGAEGESTTEEGETKEESSEEKSEEPKDEKKEE